VTRRESEKYTRNRRKAKRRSPRDEREIEQLVRDGVERFMLKKATIADFLKTIRSADKQDSVSPHPLTRAVFSRIVKQATTKHKRQRSDEQTLSLAHEHKGRSAKACSKPTGLQPKEKQA